MGDGEDLIGKTIGKLKILGRLGYGQTSSIFRAWYAPLGKEVAVKILKEDMKASAEMRNKFVNEARALARLDHQNIVKVFDVVEQAGYLCIVMELLEGRDVWQVLRDDGPLDAERAVTVVSEIARALEAAHQQQIVHRDVKPQNIMLVGRRGQAKLLDFGLATEGVAVGRAGTPHYMSPEQIQGKRIEEKSDIYSLGATFHHMLTGSPPYSGKTAKEIQEKHLEGKLPTPSRARLETPVPKALDPVVKRMMAPVPGYRYSAKDLAAALSELNLAAGGRRRQVHAAHAATRRNRNAPLILAAAGVGVLLVALVLVLLLTGKDRKPATPPPGGPGGTVPVAGGGTQDLTIPADRADEKEQRVARAEKSFRQAESFAAANNGQYDKVLAEYKKVWDEYGDLDWGQKARSKMREIEAQRDSRVRAAEEASRAEKKRMAREALDRSLAETAKSYEFSKAEKYLTDFQLEWGEDPDLVRKGRILEYAARLFETLAGEIAMNERKYPLSKFKSGVPETAMVEGADPDRVLIREGSLDRREPWSYFAPDELVKLAQIQLSRRDPETFCLLHAFLVAVGKDQEAADQLQNGELVDRAGKIDEYKRYLTGK